jgi:hypothetical protein
MKAGTQSITGNKNFIGDLAYYNTNDVIFNSSAKIMTYNIFNNAIVSGTDIEYCAKQNCVFTEGDQVINGNKKFNGNVIVDKDAEFYSEKILFGVGEVPTAGWYSVAIIDDNNPSVIDGINQIPKGTSKIIYVDDYTNQLIDINVNNHFNLFSHLNLKSYGSAPFSYSVAQMRILGGSINDGAILQMYFVVAQNGKALYNTPDFINSGWRLVVPTTSQTSFTDTEGVVRTLVNGASFTQKKIVDLNQSNLNLLNGGQTFSSDVYIQNNLKVNQIFSTLNEISAPTNLVSLTLQSGFTGGFVVSGTTHYSLPKIHREKNLVRLSGLISTTSGNFNNNDEIAVIPSIYRPVTSKNFVCSSIDGVAITVQIFGTNYSTNDKLVIKGTHGTSTLQLDQIFYFVDI